MVKGWGEKAVHLDNADHCAVTLENQREPVIRREPQSQGISIESPGPIEVPGRDKTDDWTGSEHGLVCDFLRPVSNQNPDAAGSGLVYAVWFTALIFCR